MPCASGRWLDSYRLERERALCRQFVRGGEQSLYPAMRQHRVQEARVVPSVEREGIGCMLGLCALLALSVPYYVACRDRLRLAGGVVVITRHCGQASVPFARGAPISSGSRSGSRLCLDAFGFVQATCDLRVRVRL